MSLAPLKMAILTSLALMLVLSAGRLLAQLPLSPANLGDQEYRRQQELERKRREKRGDEARTYISSPVPRRRILWPNGLLFCRAYGGAW